MKMKYRKKLKYIFFMLWMTILVIIFFPISVKAMEEEEKEQLGLVDNPYYAYYQGLSEEEKEKFEVIPRPYLLQKPLLIDKDGVHTQENKIALYRARQVLPTKYTLEQDIKIAAKNQKSLEICWAFTAFRCLETHLALNGAGYYDFSELHLDYLTSDYIVEVIFMILLIMSKMVRDLSWKKICLCSLMLLQKISKNQTK